MHDEYEERIARALQAEAEAFPMTITAEQVEERLSRSTGLSWLMPALAAMGVTAVVALALVLGGAAPSGLFGEASAEPSATASAWPEVTELPPGNWVSNSAFESGSICVAISVSQPKAHSHPAWWWHPGSGPDCNSRGSSIESTTADTTEFPLVRIATPPMPDGRRELSLRLMSVTDDELNLHGVPFYRVEEFDPAEWPRGELDPG